MMASLWRQYEHRIWRPSSLPPPKVWDIWSTSRNSKEDGAVIQTLVGHGATITSLADSRDGVIVSR